MGEHSRQKEPPVKGSVAEAACVLELHVYWACVAGVRLAGVELSERERSRWWSESDNWDGLLDYVRLYMQLKGFLPFDERRDMVWFLFLKNYYLLCWEQTVANPKDHWMYFRGLWLSIPVIILNSFFKYGHVFCLFIIVLYQLGLAVGKMPICRCKSFFPT